MRNLESILKSKDSILPTKVHMVKALIFPVDMHTDVRIGPSFKAECWRIDAFELRCWRRLLRVSWTARRSSQSILKEINPENSLEGLMLKLKLQSFGHLMWRAESLQKTQMLGKNEGSRRRTHWASPRGQLRMMLTRPAFTHRKGLGRHITAACSEPSGVHESFSTGHRSWLPNHSPTSWAVVQQGAGNVTVLPGICWEVSTYPQDKNTRPRAVKGPAVYPLAREPEVLSTLAEHGSLLSPEPWVVCFRTLLWISRSGGQRNLNF